MPRKKTSPNLDGLMPTFSQYRSKRLILRPLSLRDYQTWLQSQEATLPPIDKFDVAALPIERRTRKVFRHSVLEQERAARRDLRYVWNLFVRSSGELVGFIDVKTVSRFPHQMADIGYFITNHYRGRGYAKEAIRKLIPGVFKDLGFHRLEAVIDLDNRPSIALAKSAGLYREGIKKHYWFQNGSWEDQVVYIATPELFK